MRLTLCEAPTRETRPDHNTRNDVPYSLYCACGFLKSPATYVALQETRPTVYSPYPRRIIQFTNREILSVGSLKPHQMSFTQSKNQSRHHKATQNMTNSKGNTTVIRRTTIQPTPTASPTVEFATDKVGSPSLYQQLIYFLGAFLGIIWTPLSIYFVYLCASRHSQLRMRR